MPPRRPHGGTVSPALVEAIELAGPIVEHAIEKLVLDLLARRDPRSAVEWHASVAAHSLATEKALDAEGVL